jgi:hypothetical protein
MRRSPRLVVFVVVLTGCSSSGSNNAGSPDATTTPDATLNDGPAPGDGSPGDATPGDGAPDAGPVRCPSYNPLKNPYFGDLHQHTAFSLDAYSFATRNTPLDAYAFARGQALQVAAADDGGGPITQIDKNLDFLAVTDHSEWLAATYGCSDDLDGGPYDDASPYYSSPTCALIRSTVPADQDYVFRHMTPLRDTLCDGGQCAPVIQSAWQAEQNAAATANDPCHFTSFVAYEWTAIATDALGGHTNHRNVIFASDQVPTAPLDSLQYPAPLDMWTALDTACAPGSGCSVITIPHNSNLSNGHTFEIPDGGAALMAKYQVLAEIFQHKGSSECYYDPADAGTLECLYEHVPASYTPNNPAGNVRSALGSGLAAYSASRDAGGAGVDPLQLGIVGATDDHNGTPGNVRESTWPGHGGRNDDAPAKRLNGAWYFNPGGLTAAWAEENTRDSIFAAFKRRETYATSGPRILVRFYQAWSPGDPCNDAQFPEGILAAGGVPMGSTFAAAPADAGSASPSFVVYAWKDADPLERIDIVKGWIDASGQPEEHVYYNAITPTAAGSACLVWQDPSFTATPSYYYARVLQVPTWRWSHYDCQADPTANPAGCADGGGLDIMERERAWTSPIWYLP